MSGRHDVGTLVLVINSGSSSIKYQLVDPDSGEAQATGLIERIGEPSGLATHHAGDQTLTHEGPIPDHSAALGIALQLFADAGQHLTSDDLIAVGHRVVHGGRYFTDPVVVGNRELEEIKELSELAPLHNPANAAGIEQARERFPGVPQVAVFDTAFFSRLPAEAATYALDKAVSERYGLRRYGFHGTSHQYVSTAAAVHLRRDVFELKQIVLHLGNGASASAIRGGRAIETSMGLAPLEGLVMGTRSGDVDPGVLLHLLRTGDFDVDSLDTLLNKKSGVYGLSGVTDFRDLSDRAESGNADARLAVDVYCHRARKYIGAYLAVLGGADTLIFTAGVGENAIAIRQQIVAGLEPIGIAIDAGRNQIRSSEPRVISPEGCAVTVLVVPTNEELAIARASAALVRGAVR